MKKGKTKTKTKKEKNLKSPFDPLGSFPGTYLTGEYEDPVQDVDDL